MKTKQLHLLVIVTAQVLLASNLAADPLGRAFTYQGRLNDGGAPASGNYDLKFTLYDSAGGANIINAPLTNATTPVSSGLFTVVLDFGPGAFSGDARWLEIGVRTNGSLSDFVLLTPRQSLTATPFARYAASAGTADTALATAAGAVNNASLASGAVTSDRIADGTIATVDIASIDAGKIVGGDLLASRLKVGSGHFLNGYLATISGGRDHSANGDYVTIAGGRANTIFSYSHYSCIGGGQQNVVGDSTTHSVIDGGFANTLRSYCSYSVIGGGGGNAVNSSSATIAGGQTNIANAEFTTVSGGYRNSASNRADTVSGGWGNIANGWFATVAGGFGNLATNQYATVGGGYQNIATNSNATVSGGYLNQASGSASAIAGGSGNKAIGAYSTAGGGANNTASGDYSTIPGGVSCQATGLESFAAGYSAQALHGGAFVWGSGGPATASTNANSVTFRASGGYRLFTGSGVSGAYLGPGSGSWTSMSDRNAKEGFQPINQLEVLNKVIALPLSTWKYKSQDPSVRHIGPMAQDFKAAFAVGESDTGITTVDADGVALAAIQGLNQKVEARSQESEVSMQKLEAVNSELWQEVAELKALVQALAEKVNGGGQ